MKGISKGSSFLGVAIATLVLLLGCSTKKNKFPNRAYHNLNARFNGFYWAREALKEGVLKLDKSHVDDYSRILPFYRYADEKAAFSNNSHWDRAITKTSTVIAKHSMLIKGKEHCRWIDENYLVLGQGHYFKRDYFEAIDVFEYVVYKYKDNPSKYLALLWLIKTYNAQNSVINTQAIIALLDADKNFPKKHQGMLESLKAEYFVMMGDREKAIAALKKAIPLEKSKKQRARLTFILAQLHEELGQHSKASNYYQQCASMAPPYEMLFNAKIRRALTVSSRNNKAVKKELHKMLQDPKNREYRDQIHFALGEMAIKEKDTTLAVKHFSLSAITSVTNTRQKAESYLRLADINFERRSYRYAQAYYDSTVTFLPKDHKEYFTASNKKSSLTSLIRNIETIYAEDSLMKISMWDTVKINKHIDNIIEEITKKEEKEKELASNLNNPNNPFNPANNQNNPNSQNTNSSGNWYFYNPSQISFGVADFLKRWGPREHEDDWRRSNKQSALPEEGENTVSGKDSVPKNEVVVSDNKKREYYLKNIPFSEEAKKKSKEKTVEAYYTLGNIYKEQLQDIPQAIETFEEFLKKHPENKYQLSCYYLLYRMYLSISDKGMSDKYRNLILGKYPDTEYARMIKNPEYGKELMASKNEVEKFYNETYSQFKKGNYAAVISRCQTADSLYGKTDIAPKFLLLRAMAIGKTGNQPEYENALQKIIIKYPKDPVRTKAQELLDASKKLSASGFTPSPADTVKEKPLFEYDKKAEHFVIVLFSGQRFKGNDLKIKISDFNAEYFANSSLNISSSLFDLETGLVVIKSYNGGDKAYDYTRMLVGDVKIFGDADLNEYQVLAISSDNYAKLLQSRKKNEYFKFHQENYAVKKP